MSPQRYTSSPTDADALSSLVRVHLSRPSRIFRFDLPPGATLHVQGGDAAMLYAMAKGTVGVRQNGHHQRLIAGDLLLLTGDHGQSVTAEGDASSGIEWILPTEPNPSTGGAARIFHRSAPEAVATVVCVPVRATGGGRSPLLDLLPEVIHHNVTREACVHLLNMLAAAIEHDDIGDTALSALLAQAMLVSLLQHHFRGPNRSTLRVIHDPRLMRAISTLHADLAHPWSVTELAKVAGMSESLFRSRLRSAVGEPWRTYVQRVRIRRAAHLLATPDAAVAQVASAVGYQSESSFSRAFLTIVGIRPGQFISEHACPAQI
jgi:AraC-like DNA-binding protein